MNDDEFVIPMADERRDNMLRILNDDGAPECECATPKDDQGICLSCGLWINYRSKA